MIFVWITYVYPIIWCTWREGFQEGSQSHRTPHCSPLSGETHITHEMAKFGSKHSHITWCHILNRFL